MAGRERRDTIEGEQETREPQSGEVPGADDLTVARARSGDVAAFESLYRRHADRVYALCLRACADPGRAEELVQDVFVRCWERLHTFAGRARFSTWLYRLAVNRVTDALRSEARRAGHWAPQEAAANVAAAPAAEPETRIDLETAIQALPSGARIVFVLHDVEGLAHEEIAAAAGISVGTSKSQLYRARRLLREMLAR